MTACASTDKHSATAIRLPEKPVATELLIEHERPAPPENGSPESLLHHAAHFGAYCQKLANQVSGWQNWYRQDSRLPEGKQKDSP
ncbi:MAG: hypothetical protein Q4B82_09170 [Alysiella sp.]|uniref:hypothetical protein n=1 Tax=Alysiella sp. TaxID=1872483 RepID=UPI0026DB02A4|nr:hypothetical protein [Alysiella sp.]MDO4434731.1 hypothetical protein [Alysiella sp.]